MFDYWISRREELTLAKAQGSQRGESGINHGWARINADPEKSSVFRVQRGEKGGRNSCPPFQFISQMANTHTGKGSAKARELGIRHWGEGGKDGMLE